MAKKLRDWFKKKLSKKYSYQIVSDVPDSVKSKTIYIVENDVFPWQIVMVCPCGCKKLLHMNLMKEYFPYWKYRVDKKNRITLEPSIHRVVGCESHFFIRKGKVIWAGVFWD